MELSSALHSEEVQKERNQTEVDYLVELEQLRTKVSPTIYFKFVS